MTEVTLSQMLVSREERVKKQRSVLAQFGYPLISFTMNIAGPVKTSPLIERSFFEGIKLLKEKLPKDSILYQDTSLKPTGCEAFFSVMLKAESVKKICESIEEGTLLGRLFDMDVIDVDEKNSKEKILADV